MKKAALITGASSGIGAATARLFSKNGYFVYLLGRNTENLEQVALGCPAGSSILKCDLADSKLIQKAINHLHERSDTNLDVLVNNAGIFLRDSFNDKEITSWRKQFETNLFGAVELTNGLVDLLIKNKGSIVNVSSGLGLRPSANVVGYSASKAAMNAWTLGLAQELGPQGVRVNVVCPGLVDTPIHDFNKLPAKEKQAALDKMANLQPLGRVGTPEEIAESIYFLGTSGSRWTTGAVLTVDGGINLT